MGVPARSSVYAIALSGGADSLALAYWARKTYGHAARYAFVIDHGLQKGSEDVAAQAARQAEMLGFRVWVEKLQWAGTPPRQQSHWRKARLAMLRTMALKTQTTHLLFGHQQDDQIELILKVVW